MKKRLTSYTFDASAQTVVHADFSDITLAGIQLIVNVTDQIIIYNFADTSKGGTLSTDTLTLEYDTTLMSDTDELMIIVEDGLTTQAVSGTVTANLSATDNAVLDSIDTKVTGLATSAKQDTLDTSINTLLKPASTLAAVTSITNPVAVTNAGITTIAGAVSGTEMQVDVLTMPTTTVQATNLDIRDLSSATDSVAVTGTVTANAGTNLNTSALALESGGNLATIAAKDFATQTTLAAMNAKMVSGTDIGDVTINNASGASAVNIQDGGNTITVDGTVAVTNSDITSIKTAVEILDNAISGSEMQVDIVASLPAGTNAIGKLAANSGVDIGDVDVTSLPALAAGTNTIGAVKSVPSDIDINGGNANHADKYYTNAGAVTDGIVWSPAAGKRWHILTLYINVSAAATVTLEDDLAGGDVVRWKGELAANSGVILTYDKEHPFCSGEDAADLIITTTAGNVYVQAVGYEV